MAEAETLEKTKVEKVEVDNPEVPLTTQAELEAIFVALGLDKTNEIFDKTLRQFDIVKQQCLLESPQRNWLACCFYTTVWSSCSVTMKPTILFSVNALIDACMLSVMEFFDKLERWAVLMNGNPRLFDHIEKVQGNLSVSIIVFQKFLPIFREIFIPKQETSLGEPGRKITITTFKIFEYIWILYCAFKKHLQKGSEDLLNCFHLLLIIVDLIVNDMIELKLKRFIRKEFFNELAARDQPALDYFCELHNGVALDAKHFRSHWFFTQMKTFFESRYLKFKIESYNGLLSNIMFNLEYLNTIYEEAVYDKLEVDERIFVTHIKPEMIYDENVDFGIVTNIRAPPDGTFSRNKDLLSKKATEYSLNKVNTNRCLKTPLSGKVYLSNSEMLVPSSNENEMTRAEKLMILLETPEEEGANELYEELMKTGEVAAAVDTMVLRLNETLIERINTEHEANPDFDAAFDAEVQTHLQIVYQLLHRFLQRITHMEHEKIGNPTTTVECLAGVYQRSEFVASLYVCCLEIVLFTYGSNREFPWSVGIAGISPLAFYKIIEFVIRSDGDLSRDILKHLSRVEERVLEELAWEVTSPLWKTLSDEIKFPSFDEVMMPEKLGPDVTPRSIPPPLQSNIASRYGIIGKANAKRRLDYDDNEFEPVTKKSIVKIKPNNSLFIFARKLYYLAALHLNDLCDRVRMDERARRKVWTLFEHIIRNETSLMYGRHIDQNIMCCLYIIAKVSSMNVPFHEILYHYRHQPQSSSRIYRNVLISFTQSPATGIPSDDGASRDSISSISQQSAANGVTAMRSGSTMPAPGMRSAPPTPEPHNAEYHDLITYYNKVFVRRVEDYVKRLAFPDESNANRIQLLSLPTIRCSTLSPRRSISQTLSIAPLGSNQPPTSPSRPMRFNVNRSPSKDLHHINAVVRHAATYRLSQY